MPRTSCAVAPSAATVEESSSPSDASDKFELSEKKIVGNAAMAALLTLQIDFSTTEAIAVDISMESEAVVCPMLHPSVAAAPPVASTEELSLYSDAYDKFKLTMKEIAGNPLATSLFPSPKPSQMPYTDKKMLCVNGWSERASARARHACGIPPSFLILLPWQHSGNNLMIEANKISVKFQLKKA